jgi:leucyl/phenylalanyl-tRNA---protein transferase
VNDTDPELHWLHSQDDLLPSTHLAWPFGSPAPGLLAAGGMLTPERLTEAYKKGVFPWYSTGQPVLWWSPDPRMVLRLDDFKLSRSLRKTVRQFAHSSVCEIRIDTDFSGVINACSQTPRAGQSGTWIVPEMVQAYCHWHALGVAHSIEVWVHDRLVGGLYGVNIGHMFFGESMFSHATDASKIALCALVCFCRSQDIDSIDCQQHTAHLASFGAKEIPRIEFEQLLKGRLNQPAIASWKYESELWQYLQLG